MKHEIKEYDKHESWTDIFNDLCGDTYTASKYGHINNLVDSDYFLNLYRKMNKENGIDFGDFVNTYLSEKLLDGFKKRIGIIIKILREEDITFDEISEKLDAKTVTWILGSISQHGDVNMKFNKKQREYLYKACLNFDKLDDFLAFAKQHDSLVAKLTKTQIKDVVYSYCGEKPVFDVIRKNSYRDERTTKELFLFTLTKNEDFDKWFGKRKISFGNETGFRFGNIVRMTQKIMVGDKIDYERIEKLINYSIFFELGFHKNTPIETMNEVREFFIEKGKINKRNRVITSSLENIYRNILKDYELELGTKEELILDLYTTRASIATELDRSFGINIIKNFSKL